MAIQKTDIKLMGSQRLTDFYDGGGQMTGAEIIDGQVNNLFPDISRLDRVYGRVSLRKAYPAVMTQNTDMYYGAHAIITEPPEDDNVHVTLFSTGDFYDIRDDAKNRIESYVSIAQELIWRPLNDQLEGQRAILVFAKPGTVRPEISDTIVLKNSTSGGQQYLRITSLSAETVQFSHTTYGNYTLEVLNLGISAALNQTFPGIEATPFTTKAVTRVHATVVADASNYYGVSRLAQQANQGQLHFWVDSIYNQLVPTSQIETALVDQRMGGNLVAHIAKGPPGSLTFSGTRSNTANVVHLPSGVLPGSLSLSVGGYTFTDVRGRLSIEGADGGYSGSVDYTSGQVVIERTSAWSGTVTIAATPAVAVAQSFVSREIKIELANRAYNYTPSLTGPLPSPGSIHISYMAQGKWYDLFDNGQGVLVGNEEGIGTGTINYATGSMILTVGALPDVGSSIIIQWGHSIEIADRRGDLAPQPVPIRRQLPHEGIEPGSIHITWVDGATPKTAADNGQGGLTGDATGIISYAAGEVLFVPASLPPSDTQYSISYNQRIAAQSSITADAWSTAGNDITLTIPGAPLRPGSVGLSWVANRNPVGYSTGSQTTVVVTHRLRDNGQGGLIHVASGETVGSINYTSGLATFRARYVYTKTVYTFQFLATSAGG